MSASEERHLLPRDILLRDTFTAAESMLFVVILAITTVAFWAADPRSFWTLGSCMIVGLVSPVILKAHEHYHPFHVGKLWRKTFLLTAPASILLVLYLLGLFNQPFAAVTADGQPVTGLNTGSPFVPTTTQPADNWIVLCGFAGAYVIAACLFLIPKSHAFFERLVPLLVAHAVVLCLTGFALIAFGAEGIPLVGSTGRTDFFATFTYDGHWAAFAMLWGTFSIAYGLLEARRKPSEDLIGSTTLWYFAAGILLGTSGFFVESRWASFLQVSLLALMLAVSALRLGQQKPPIPRRRAIILLFSLASIGFAVAAAIRLYATPQGEYSVSALRHSAWTMFLQKPVFGWGVDSFRHILPFFTDDHLSGERYTSAVSDVLQLLAEQGLVGIGLYVAVIVILVVRLLRAKSRFPVAWYSLVGCAAVLVTAAFELPFMSPTVTLSFWIIFFSVMRWADLERFRVDEVDQRPRLVTPEALRRVPFYTGPHKEESK